MPRRRGNGPEHARARRRAQEATVSSLVADAVTGRPRPERGGGPYATPGDARDRESRPAGAHRP